MACFNPRPDPKTGAIACPGQARPPISVSIRAPIRRPGRSRRRNPGPCRTQFQSAPRSEDRGDSPAHSVHLPGAVSIRAPIRRPGRCLLLDEIPDAAWFQSAPRSEDRGDGGSILRLGRKGFVDHFRQPANTFCFDEVPYVKERSKLSATIGLSVRRELFRVGPALGVRGGHFTRSAVR